MSADVIPQSRSSKHFHTEFQDALDLTPKATPKRKSSKHTHYQSHETFQEHSTPQDKHNAPKKSKHELLRGRSESPVPLHGLPDLSDMESPEKIEESTGLGQGKKWTPKKENMLASMWEDEPHLFDPTHRDYRDSVKRKTTLLRFSAALNMTGK